MLPFSSWADRLLILTMGLSGVATFFGVAACPFQSLAMQRAFLYFSLATLLGTMISFIWHAARRTPYPLIAKLCVGLVPLLLVWVVLLLPVQQVREMSGRGQFINNGKQIGLAWQGYGDANKILPTDRRDPMGIPLLSWRVGVLPYMDQALLFTQFDSTQPWDGPRNALLVDKMPYIYTSLLFHEKEGHTPWQGFVGPGTAFEPGPGLRLAGDFPDGTSNTILIVEAKLHVPWSKLADIAYGPGIPLPPLGQEYLRKGEWPFCCNVRGGGGFHACMADGTVRFFRSDVSEETLRALIVRNDGKGVIDD